MPARKIRNGNAYIESASVNYAHGTSAPTAEIHADRLVSYRNNSRVTINIGGSNWRGYVDSYHNLKKEQSGKTTRVTAIDIRDDLFNVTVFARINMIDSRTGEVWSTIEAIPDTSEKVRTWFITDFDEPTRSTALLQLIPERFLQQDADTWINQDVTLEKIYPREIITWLLALAGFRARFSSKVENILRSTETTSWKNSRYNVYNIDWNTGVKVAAALDQICNALGIQMYYLHDSNRTMRFTKIGEPNYTSLQWDSVEAVDHEDGKAIQKDVDTGVWIVGGRNLLEWTGIPLLPAWNRAWDKYFLNFNLLKREIGAINSALTDSLDSGAITQEEYDSAAVNMITTTVFEFLPDYGFVEGKFFNDMTISEYIRTVPFHVYRIQGMENLLSEDEYDGTRPVREAKITRPLVTNPAKDFTVIGHSMGVDQTKRVKLPIGTDVIELEEGYTVHEDTGHVVFSEAKWWFKEGTDINKVYELEPNANGEYPDIVADPDLKITAVFFGEVYRKFYGTPERIGNHFVNGLRKAFVIEDASKGIVFVEQANRDKEGNKVPRDDGLEEVDEYVPDGERPANDEAQDIATSILDRPRVVRSGNSTYVGTASHEPSGEIQRVTVSLNDSEGIKETITYANDEPSLIYEPQIELKRKLANDQRVKDLARLESDARNKKFNEALKKLSGGGKSANEPVAGAVDELKMRAVNKDNWVEVRNPNDEEFESGEPVAASYNDSDDLEATLKSDVAAGDEKFMGVSVSRSNGPMNVVTTGFAHARVMGPIDQGSTLRIAEGGGHFEVGSGPAIALKSVTEAEVALIPVKIGGGGGGTIITEVDCVSILNVAFTQGDADENPGDPVLDDDTNNALMDSVDLTAFLAEDGINQRPVIVLLWQQDDPTENGIYSYDPTVEPITAEQRDAGVEQEPKWSKLSDLSKASFEGKLITVLNGTRFMHMQFNVRKDDNAALSFNRGVIAVRLASNDEDLVFETIDEQWDGQDLDVGDLVMRYTDSGTVTNDGIYIVQEGAWKRIARPPLVTDDVNDPPDEAILVPGQQINVLQGNVNFRRPFVITPT